MSLSGWWKRVRSRTFHEEEPLIQDSETSINDGGHQRTVSSVMRHALRTDSELHPMEGRREADRPTHEGWTRRNWISRIPYYIPILTWFPEYKWKTNFLRDIIAGTAVAMMLVPQSLAYASIAGLQPIYGLYTSWLPLIIYAVLGTSKQLSVGPDILGSLLVGLVVTTLPAGSSASADAAAAAALAHFLALLVGLLVFLLGLFRVGFIDNVLSRPLLSGFVNALALYIMTEQADVFLGMPAIQDLHGWHKLPYVLDHLDKVNFIAFGMGLGSVFFLLVFRILRRYLGQKSAIGLILKYTPEIMIVVVVSELVVYFFHLSEAPYNVIIMGDIQGGFPVPILPQFNLTLIRQYLPNAITIGLLGFVESIVVAKLYARKNNYLISANRDMVALGAANIFGSFFRIYPTFGSLPRSFIANMYGATSQMFGLIASCWILLTLMALRHIFWYLPKVAMSAIVISAAVSLIEFDQIIFLVHLRAWQEILLAALTFTLTYVLGVDLGILLSLTISVFLVIRHSSLPHMSILGRTPEGRYRDVTQHKNAQLIPGVLLVSIDEGLYFANIEHIKQMFLRVERLGSIGAHPSQKNRAASIYAMIINAKNISEVDAGAAEILTEMKKDWEGRGICCCFVKLRPTVRDVLIRAGMLKGENDPFLFKNMDDAVSRFVASL